MWEQTFLKALCRKRSFLIAEEAMAVVCIAYQWNAEGTLRSQSMPPMLTLDLAVGDYHILEQGLIGQSWHLKEHQILLSVHALFDLQKSIKSCTISSDTILGSMLFPPTKGHQILADIVRYMAQGLLYCLQPKSFDAKIPFRMSRET